MCECSNIEIGSYDNLITVKVPPKHMREYRKRTNFLSTSICIDKCISKEVQDLWAKGITTTGCCCGHNKVPGFIGVVFEDIQKMKDLGYKVHENKCRPGDEDSFQPKDMRG